MWRARLAVLVDLDLIFFKKKRINTIRHWNEKLVCRKWKWKTMNKMWYRHQMTLYFVTLVECLLYQNASHLHYIAVYIHLYGNDGEKRAPLKAEAQMGSLYWVAHPPGISCHNELAIPHIRCCRALFARSFNTVPPLSLSLWRWNRSLLYTTYTTGNKHFHHYNSVKRWRTETAVTLSTAGLKPKISHQHSILAPRADRVPTDDMAIGYIR